MTLRVAFDTAAWASPVVIGEFRLRGPNGGNDELIELFNAAEVAVDMGGWKLKGSSASGAIAVRATIPAGTVLLPGCRYLLTNSNGPYSGEVTGDLSFTLGIADDGGIALTLANDEIVDQVGLGAASAFKEGSLLTPLTLNQNRGFERRPGGSDGNGSDSNDNGADFFVVAPSGPQSMASACVAPRSTASPTTSATETPTWSPTSTATESPTATATSTMTPTATSSLTPSPSTTPTETATGTASQTPTVTPSVSQSASTTATPTRTPSVTSTSSATATGTMSPTRSATASVTPSPRHTPSASPTVTGEVSATPTATVARCGNGVLDDGEQCDDGNVVDGDSCPSHCDLGAAGQLIRGDRRPAARSRSACLAEWHLRSTALSMDRFGLPDAAQECMDQDESCDVDPAPGRCRVLVRLCLNNRDVNVPECGARAILGVDVLAPRPRKDRSPGNRQALLTALADLPVPLRSGFCTPAFAVDLVVGAKRMARERLAVRVEEAISLRGFGHRSRLHIACRASS